MQINLEHFIDHLFRFALSLTRDPDAAEELTQDCLLRAMRKSSQLVEEEAVKPWLFQIMVNLWKDKLKKKRLDTDPSINVNGLALPESTPQQHAIQNETRTDILAMIQALPTRQRTVLHLAIVEQMSLDEIAATLSLTKNAVKANLSIGRKTLRKSLVEKGTVNREWIK